MVSKGFVKDYEVILNRRDGELRTVLISATIHHDKADKATTYRGVLRDVTEQRRFGEQLVQAQKMETVGHLAGGIAHDFNNLLTAIRGYIDLAMTEITQDSPVFDDLTEARRVTDRAAELTRQMLLFSRREPMVLAVIDLNAVINDLLGMLGRLLGEQYRITSSFEDELGTVTADHSYIEQVIMNLVINARDAMATGGEITITTCNVSIDEADAGKDSRAMVGEFVRLSVQDSGEGMDTKTRLRIFEPFFSTKGVNKGTGLGLSVVYGIVTQLKGWIEVISTPGKGSTFHVYFPMISAKRIKKSETNRAINMPKGQDERILLVEDQDSVRDIAEKILRKHGYDVRVAADADTAMAVFEQEEGDFDLVFCDVILPGEDGLHLAERLQSLKPGLRVLLASGYVEDKLLGDIREKSMPFIQKPYSMENLLRVVREMLAS
ncbi:MAG: ATP-binding protein [Thermoleophilia bacterium]